jgi:hypothetical protein
MKRNLDDEKVHHPFLSSSSLLQSRSSSSTTTNPVATSYPTILAASMLPNQIRMNHPHDSTTNHNETTESRE